MLSYMLDRQGYLLVNRAVVGGDVSDFEYTPKPEFDGPFTVVNVADERALLVAWFDHMRRARPGVYVTYNGDFFDWPFVEARAAKHGLDMAERIGFSKGDKTECLAKAAVHMDCMHWVNRDSYLPQGSRGLKVCFFVRCVCVFVCLCAFRGPSVINNDPSHPHTKQTNTKPTKPKRR